MKGGGGRERSLRRVMRKRFEGKVIGRVIESVFPVQVLL